MKKYIDADFLIEEIEKYNKDNWNAITWSSKMVATLLRNSQKVDAVEVVRCKDCILFGKIACPMHNSVFPGTTEECYCCFGERQEDDS